MTFRPTIIALCAVVLLCPAAHGSTFGNTSAATTDSPNSAEGQIAGMVFTLSEAALPTSITASVLSVTATRRWRFAIYRDSDDRLIAETYEIYVAASASRQSVTANFPRVFNLPAGDYRIVWWAQSTSGTAGISLSATSGGAIDGEAETYSVATPNPGERYPLTIVPGNPPDDDIPCIYVTYTAGSRPTFGHELREAEFTSTCENDIRAGDFAMDAVAGTADSLVVLIENTAVAGSPGTFNIGGAIYDTLTDALVDSTAWLAISDTVLTRWYSLEFVMGGSLEASKGYMICAWAATSTGTTPSIQFLGSTGLGTRHVSDAFGAWPSTSGTSYVDTDGLQSSYVIYTETPTGSGRRHRDNAFVPFKAMPQRFYWPHVIGTFCRCENEIPR